MHISALEWINIFKLLLWSILWILGGWWIVKASFKLRSNEEALAGIAAGLIIETWIANLLGQFINLPAAFWLAAILVFLIGVILLAPKGWKAFVRLPIKPAQLILLLVLIYVFIAIGRGLAIFDDYAHLPTISLIAAGEIPPQFALDPSLSYGYHYFLLVTGAQFMRIADFYPWVALDIARGITIGLAIMLSAIWTQRLTNSALAGFFGALMTAFGSGTRWLMLLLPAPILSRISNQINLIGSAAQSAPNLTTALYSTWAIEGGGPFAYPLAYLNGLTMPGILSFGSNGMIGTVLMLLIFLTFNRWRGYRGLLITAMLLSPLGLIAETTAGLILGGFFLVTIAHMLRYKTLKIPTSLKNWWVVMLIMLFFMFIQGGTWSGLATDWFQNVFMGKEALSYDDTKFLFIWPMTFISSHLGILSLGNIWQIIALLFELGPLLLVLPLVAFWGIKAFRAGRWFEASFIFYGFATLGMVFLQTTSEYNGIRNSSRLYSFVGMTKFYAVPLVWIWAKNRSEITRVFSAAAGMLVIVSGIVIMSIQMIAAQVPVRSDMIDSMDEDMFDVYWDELEPGALIFGRNSTRIPIIFGRYTRSSLSWRVENKDWTKLYKTPDPYILKEVGFDYLYLDYIFWYDVKEEYRAMYADPCVIELERLEQKRGDDFRWLLDIRSCEN
ncbi:MAG: hypothetical protein JEZ06_02520 [Anaerolineaceae bacterium]|nr:hypothetical protein [Anaerolineaceae bacterium]